MKIEAALTYDKIRHDQDHDAHLVISLTAPAQEGEARAPICVVPVVDVSGSMRGDKLEYAKRSAIKLIDHLRPGDYTGLIVFESSVHVIIPPQKITPEVKDKMKAEVAKLRVMGGTNFAGGMLKAIELVQALDLPDGVLHRVIMLTDGQANEGPAKLPRDIIKLFEANAGRVTASAFGFGNDVSQQFLGDFAREAKGNYAYIRDPDGALTAFGKELGGLISTYATDIVLELNALAGHEVTSVVSDVEAEEEDVGGEITIKIPEILAEERRDLVFAVKLKAQKQAFPRPLNVFDVAATFDTIAPDGKREKKTAEGKAKAQFVKPGEENAKPNEALDKIVALAEVVRAQIEAEEKVKAGDFATAAQVMQNAVGAMDARGYKHLAAVASKTAGSVSDAHSYNASAGFLRSFREGGTRGVGGAMYEASAASALADAGVMLCTSSQSTTSDSFASGGVVNPSPAAGPAPQPMDFTSILVPGGTVASGAGAAIPNVNFGDMSTMTVTATGLPQGVMWAGQTGHPLAPPPVSQTNDADAKEDPKLVLTREKALDKASKRHLSKKKSSARW